MIEPPAFSKRAEITAAIRRVEELLAPDVVRIRYDIEEDWAGDWAIFFRIVLSDDAAKKDRLRDIANKVRHEISRQLDFPSLGVYPYHNFRSVSEQKAKPQPAWA